MDVSVEKNEKITLTKLERYLWSAANVLRGKIDSGEFKHYILGLLFYKRLCDVWQENNQYQKSTDPLSKPRFHIPAAYSWEAIRKHRHYIGKYLNEAFQAIEYANPCLKGIFQDVNFANRERFSDNTLEVLLRHFEKFRLGRKDVEADILGSAYEYLIAQFADDAGKKGGEFYTPKMVVRLLIAMLQPEEDMSIYDPACGSGGMLLEAANYLMEQKENTKMPQLYGQEMNLNTWSICRMNLFLHDINSAHILRGDTLRDPKHITDDSKLKTFDCILVNPPFSLKNWGYEIWVDGDKYHRDIYGCPPRSYADFAFLQHMIASLNERGKLAVILSTGVLYRGGAEAQIRKRILQADLIEAVIMLANKLFYGTDIPVCVLIMRKNKPVERKNKLILINASQQFKAMRNQNHLEPMHIERIIKAFSEFQDKEHFSRVVDLEEIERHHFNLSITRYLPTIEKEPINIAATLTMLYELQTQCNSAEMELAQQLKELGYDKKGLEVSDAGGVL